jgi:arylsulfatase A-like enzyme
VREELFEKDWGREIISALGEPGMREFLRVYYGMVKLIDDQVGRILKTLDETGKADNTVVVFTADHGDMMGGHGMVWKSTRAFYEEIVRVPLIVSYPGKFKPAVSERPVDSTDFMPTLLELAGHRAPEQVQGVSLARHLRGEKEPGKVREYTFSERVRPHPKGRRRVLPGTRGDFMIRGRGWKYIRYSNRAEYLYNLRDDPGETVNLIDDPKCGSVRDQLRTDMDRWLDRTGWTGHKAAKGKTT